MSKKTYDSRRNLVRVCTKCNVLWTACQCGLDQSDLIYVNEKELAEYFNSGLVPDIAAELWMAAGCPPPIPIPYGLATKKLEYLEVLRKFSHQEETNRKKR